MHLAAFHRQREPDARGLALHVAVEEILRDVAAGRQLRHGRRQVRRDGVVVAHASVVPRALDVDGLPFRTGYVEAVATAPEVQGRGLGTAVMTAASVFAATIGLTAITIGDLAIIATAS